MRYFKSNSLTQDDPMNIHAQAAKQRPYSGFDRLPIGGEWRQGKMRALKDIDPYTDAVLLEIPQADRSDLDDAYAAGWAQEPASARGEVLHGAAHVVEMRRDEIVSWLIHRVGKHASEGKSGMGLVARDHVVGGLGRKPGEWAGSADGHSWQSQLRSAQAGGRGGRDQSMELAVASVQPFGGSRFGGGLPQYLEVLHAKRKIIRVWRGMYALRGRAQEYVPTSDLMVDFGQKAAEKG